MSARPDILLACAVLLAAGAAGAAEPIPPPHALDTLEAGVRARYEALRADVDAPSASADAYGRLGMWAHAYKYDQTALAAYRNASLLAPEDSRWPYLMAHIQRREGQVDAARASFARAIELAPDDVPARVRLAELELEAHALDAAQAQVDAALARDPRCVRALFLDGRIAHARGEPEVAIRKILSALRLQQDSGEMRYALALAYRAAGDAERAETELARASAERVQGRPPRLADPVLERMQSFQEGSRIWVKRGQRAQAEGKHPLAVRHFRQALALDPDRASLMNHYGNALMKAGRHEEALVAFEEMLRAFPDNTAARHNLGLCYAAVGDYERSIELLVPLVESDPSSGVRVALARSYRGAGRFEEALREIDAGIALEPAREPLRMERAIWLVEAGRYGQAVAALEADVEVVKPGWALRMLLSRLLSSAPDDAVRDAARSLALLEQHEERIPSVGLAESRAMAYAGVGDFAAARRWQASAVEGAERAAAPDVLRRARARLAVYEAGRPCREPWADGEQKAFEIRTRRPRI